ncbi:hypothetical protein NP493_620g01047 [Ridgeia piscesae]|uniref:Copper transport protein n=1 Tax=Ridgeia piscesae TaxID=27915 RepID=A0AAD9NNZ8_RIDPI|nr:hypothetical protein NP493_620g01047 [Ridgeia piscesae]
MCVATGGMVFFLEVLKLTQAYCGKASKPCCPPVAGDNGQAHLRPLVNGATERHQKKNRILCQAGRAGIHMVHVVVAYCIMLAVMTYNAWILIAVAIACGVGYYVFDALRRVVMNAPVSTPASPEPPAVSPGNIEPARS